MVRSSTVNASSFMVLTAGKVACEQLGAGEVTDAAWASPFPCDLQSQMAHLESNGSSKEPTAGFPPALRWGSPEFASWFCYF